MSASAFRRLTGILLIVTPVTFSVFFSLLQANFSYPTILSAPSGDVLNRFHDGGASLIATWYGFALSALLFVPLVAALHRLLASDRVPFLGIASAIGITAGIVQVLGLIRWPFLVPYLANVYVDPASSAATRDAVALVFQAFGHYAGNGVGENMGYLLTSVWTLLIALVIRRSLLFAPWLGWVGIPIALGIFAGVFVPLGIAAASTINAFSYILWALWLVVLGIVLLRSRQSASLAAVAAA